MTKRLFDGKSFTIMDGAMGTMLQAAGLAAGMRPEAVALENPALLEDIHRQYVAAGAQLLCANTFGANAKKLAGSGISVEAAVSAAVACAKKAAGDKALVALDVGPLGELLEPGGTLHFEEAYGLFAQVVQAGQAAGADAVMIETMTDLYEVKAAVLAAVENTTLPVLCSMSFERDGRTFSGVSVEAFGTAIAPLGVAALGINCSLGPADVMPLAKRLCAAAPLPVYAKPNNGLPDPVTGAYSLSAGEFCRQMRPCLENGVSLVGGCCGTTPETIAGLAAMFAGTAPARPAHLPAFRLCSATQVVQAGAPLAIGERINPTGKKKMKEALLAGDLSYLQTLAVQQQEDGAAILDVNVGAPGVDEVAMLPRAVKAVQAVSSLPLQLDSANPEALEAALRVCCGRPLVNSTSGEAEKMAAVLPLAKRYGAAVLGLTLDEAGIPPTAEGRLAVAETILKEAEKAGLAPQDVAIDCLTLTVGAQPDSAVVTLDAVRLVKEKLGLTTVLGVSNVSFGLPNRPLVNRVFLAMALAAGLDMPILNPGDTEMTDTLVAHRLLRGAPGAADAFVARFAQEGDDSTAKAPRPAAGEAAQMPLDAAIEKGLKKEAAEAARTLAAQRPGQGLAIVSEYLMPALDKVGAGFEQKRVFLPQLLAAAGAAQAAFDELRAAMGEAGQQNGPPVVVATVQGDIHDIGKNIAKVILENYGFNVIDLGRDVPPARVVDAVLQSGAKLAGLSALMTTTLPAMEETVAALKARVPACRVFVGGAVLNADYAQSIGADFFAKDAKASADYARQVHGM